MNLRERLLARTPVYRAMKELLLPATSEHRIVETMFAAGDGARVLDLGCGYGDYARHFAGRCRYVGVDHNPDYIATARRVNAGLDVEWICADLADPVVTTSGPYDLVVLGGVLHHLDDDSVVEMARAVAELLTPTGRLVALEPVFHPDQPLSARLLIAADRGRHVRDVAGYVRLLAPALPRLHTEIHTDLLRLPYTHVLLQGRLGLESVGLPGSDQESTSEWASSGLVRG